MAAVRRLLVSLRVGLAWKVMALVGTLGSMSVAEILQTLADSQADGLLRIVSPFGERTLFLQNGHIIQALPREEKEGVLQALSAHGYLPEILTHLPDDAGLIDLLAQLLAEARITKKQVQNTLSLQVQEELLTVLGWNHGSFAFFEAKDDPDLGRRLESWDGFGVSVGVKQWLSEQLLFFNSGSVFNITLTNAVFYGYHQIHR